MKIPSLTSGTKAGRALFDANSAARHRRTRFGSDQNPPLVRRIDAPCCHDDRALLLVGRQGGCARHWRLGNMPTIDSVTVDEVIQITAYVRAPQRASRIN